MLRLNQSARMLALAVLLGAGSAHAAKIQIGFQEIGNQLVPSAGLTGQLGEAAQAIQARYGAEVGFRGLTADAVTPNKIVVLTSHMRYTRAIWRKMQLNGHTSIEGGVAFFVYQSQNEPVSSYQYLGTLYMDQGSYGYLRFWQNTFVQNYMISVHEDCSVSSSRVVTAVPNTPILPTAIVRTERVGNYFRYHFSVNGGAGAELAAVSVAFAPTNKLFVITNCSATVYLETSGGPVPAVGVPHP